jgi:hypothetical protein
MAFNRSARVSWIAPADEGSSAILAYKATASNGNACSATDNLSCTVTGLTNGVTYTFSVTATNAAGTSLPSTASAGVIPAPVPDAPTGVNAIRGDRSAVVSWAAPAPNGSPITAYTVASTSGSKTCSWSSGPLNCTVTGLINGTAYQFTVTAANVLGPGPTSDPSNRVIPATIPDRPTGVTAIAGNASATVAWTAPASNGGSSITGYTVTSDPGSKTCTWSSGLLSCTVSGLTNGTPYAFRVTATNDMGTGVASDTSNTVIPLAHMTGATFVAVSPTRLLDSRDGTGGLSGAFSSRVARTFQVSGRGGVPLDATAVTGNLTVTQQSGPGYLYVGPVATNNPTSSNLNFPKGDDRANAVTVVLGAGGTLSITYATPTSGATTHVIFDVTGYFVP